MRKLTDNETHFLSAAEQEYLKAYPQVVCLQLNSQPQHALYATLYGARTISDALGMHATARRVAEQDRERQQREGNAMPVFDSYSTNEDVLVDSFGVGAALW